MKRYAALPGVLLLGLVSGCFYELRDDINECKINCYNKWQAKAAYRGMDTACLGLTCPHSFKEGFVTGYVDVANGGLGCVPAMPKISAHNHMWMDRCSDSQKMEAWYDGYEHGAMAAKAEGMADANRMITRIPQPAAVDYAMPTQSGPTGASADSSSIPPAPITDTEESGGPQTRRLTREIFE